MGAFQRHIIGYRTHSYFKVTKKHSKAKLILLLSSNSVRLSFIAGVTFSRTVLSLVVVMKCVT